VAHDAALIWPSISALVGRTTLADARQKSGAHLQLVVEIKLTVRANRPRTSPGKDAPATTPRRAVRTT